MKVHHIGYAVRDIVASTEKFEQLGYQKCSVTVEDRERDVSILFMENAGHLIELIAPLNDSSHICSILKKSGNSPYHFCYEVQNIDAEIEKLLCTGYILVEKPGKAAAIENRRVAFLYDRDVGIVELLEFLDHKCIACEGLV